MAGILFSSFALLFFSYIRHLSHRTHFLLLQFSVSSPGLSFLDTFYFMILEEKGQNPHVPAYKRMHDLAKMLYRIHIPRILAYLTEREILAGDRMMEEQQEESYPLTPIDKIANGNSLLILKALLPYLPSQKQAGAAFLVKWMEIQNIRNYYHTHPAADLTAMALPSHSVTDLFQSIAPFCRRGQREMMEQFQTLGFDVVDFQEKADVYIVNTCTVTNMADRKSRQMLHRAKKKNPDSLVVAVGCYVESGEAKLEEDSAVDAFFSNRGKEHMAERFVEQFHLTPKETQTMGSRHVEHERTRAYLKIQDGCNQFCTYCMIPYVRGKGKLVSMPEDEVISHVESLAKQGYKEVVLTGIHLSSYGVDFSDALNFVSLEGKPLLAVISKVAEIEGVERIRLGSLEPRIITESFAKELSAINDCLKEEELLVKKFKMLAEHAEDDKVKNCFKEISDKHQGHFNMLYNQL